MKRSSNKMTRLLTAAFVMALLVLATACGSTQGGNGDVLGTTREPGAGTPDEGSGVGSTAEPNSTMPPGSGGTTAEPGGTSTGGQGGEPVEIELSAQNIEFDKDTITVPAGARVVIQFTNNDEVAHNFSAYRDDTLADPIYVGELIEGPGTTVTYEFDAPTEPGTYYFQCDPHQFEMNGQFVVE